MDGQLDTTPTRLRTATPLLLLHIYPRIFTNNSYAGLRCSVLETWYKTYTAHAHFPAGPNEVEFKFTTCIYTHVGLIFVINALLL